VTDLLGNIIFTITNYYDAGEHSVPLDIDGLAIGSYMCRMVAKDKQVGVSSFIIQK